MILIFTIDQQKKEAQAFLPLFGLAPEVVAAGAALLTAVGIEFSKDESVRAAGYKFYQEATADMRAHLDQVTLTGGVLAVTAEMWLAAKFFAKTNFVDTTTQTVDTLVYGQVTTIHSSNDSDLGQLALVGSSYGMLDFTATVYNTGQGQLIFPVGYGLIQSQKDYIDGVWTYANYYHNYTANPVVNVLLSRTSGFPDTQLVTIFSSTANHFVVVNGVTVWTQDTDLPLYGTIMDTGITNVAISNALSVADTISPTNYTVNNEYYGNPAARDYTGHDITVPTTIPGVTGKGSGEIVTGDNIGPGLVAAGVAAAAAAYAAAIAAGLTPAAAAAAANAAKAAALTGASVAASAAVGAAAATATMAGTITTDIALPLPAGDKLDFSKFKLALDLFTNKFPFSLPWDIQRLIGSFGSGSVATPVLEMPIMGIPAHVSLERFNSLAAAARVFELLIFNAGLLFGTRKILGGSA